MKNLAYLRVSTAHQDVRSQRLAILEYAREQGFQIDRFIEAEASGRASRKHRRLDDLMSELSGGDRLVVSELSRLGRSLGEVIELLDAISKASIKFVAIKEKIHFEGRQDLQTKVMTTLFALFAEVERELISERTREGLAKAQSLWEEARASKGVARDVTARRTGSRDPEAAPPRCVQERCGEDYRGLATDAV